MDPILGGFIRDSAYCHTFTEAGEVSCYTAQLREAADAQLDALVGIPVDLPQLTQEAVEALRAALGVTVAAGHDVESWIVDQETADDSWTSSEAGLQVIEWAHRLEGVRQALADFLEDK